MVGLLFSACYKSVPPTGKSTGLDDLTPPAGCSTAPAQSTELSCTFAAAAEAGSDTPFHDLGLILTVREFDDQDEEAVESGRGNELQVMAYGPLRSGGIGPATHSGDRIRPGDLVVSINGGAIDMLRALAPDQSLWLAASKPVTLRFIRPPPLAARMAAEGEAGPSSSSGGGRPAERLSKNPTGGGHQPNARGGAPARRGKKPQRVQARLQRQVEVPEGSLSHQAARVSEQLLGAGYLEAELARLSALDSETTYVP